MYLNRDQTIPQLHQISYIVYPNNNNLNHGFTIYFLVRQIMILIIWLLDKFRCKHIPFLITD